MSCCKGPIHSSNFDFILNLSHYFSTQEQTHRQLSGQLNRKIFFLSWARVVLFILSATAAFFLFRGQEWGWTTLVVLAGMVGFILLVRWHQQLRFQSNHQIFLAEICQDEENRRQGLPGHGQAGLEYLEPTHPYAGDLDIFGKRSLFQLLDRTTTAFGSRLLANMLLHPADAPTIHLRQQALRELAQYPEWLRDFQASGKHFPIDYAKARQFSTWLQTPDEFSLSASYRMMCLALALLSAAVLAGAFLSAWSLLWVVPVVAINYTLLRRLGEPLEHIAHQAEAGVNTLKAAKGMIARVLNLTPDSHLLKDMRQPFEPQKEAASALEAVGKLEDGLRALHSRGNGFYATINLLFLTDVYLVHRLLQWKQTYGNRAALWLHTLGQWEALSSFAAFCFAHPDYAFPQLADTYQWEGKAVAHPLLPPQSRVANDFSLQGEGNIALITGSNMAGKSTFLRTLGVNTVLALAGGPVCAQGLKLPVVQLFTSMRTLDSLEESVSSFFAELQRIQTLLRMVEQSPLPVLFMLDELLKGTNSADRHKGAQGLMRQLSRAKAFGLISTHDLALADFTSTGSLQLYHFASEVKGQELVFDYQIKSGLCTSFNATLLMQKIGIEID
jgi:hypothetical protein